eukprot:TRINITY_DN170_c1_g4_i1.p1 TRINITY_DN170_c1_g4~~TRINITY_DN170_c1_g4_i1.p1  ORF type:complete len:722 (-),score=160.60 TRINITY_DN170_c1_g4_i1:556-2721(-)
MMQPRDLDDPFYFTLAALTQEYEGLKAENERLKARLENEQLCKESSSCELLLASSADLKDASGGRLGNDGEDEVALDVEWTPWRPPSLPETVQVPGGCEQVPAPGPSRALDGVPECGQDAWGDDHTHDEVPTNDEDAAPRPARRFMTEAALHAAPREPSKDESVTCSNTNGVGRSDQVGRVLLKDEHAEEHLDEHKDADQDDLHKNRNHVFTSLADMRHQVREKVWKKHYDVMDFYHTEGRAQLIARMPLFESFCMFVITVNAVWIAVETDMNDAPTLLESNGLIILAEVVLCLIFVIEITIRFAAFAVKRNCLHDYWFMFDFILVAIMVLETFVMSIIFEALSLDLSARSYANSSVLRIARTMKLVRLGRMAKVISGVPEIMIVIRGLLAAARSVLVTFALLCAVTYVFAVSFTAMLKDGPERHHVFSSTARSMQVLWTHGALLNDVNVMMNWLEQEGNFFPLLFFNVYLLVAALAVMNMLIGVLCNVVNIVAASEQEEAWLSYAKRRLLAVYKDEHKVLTKTQFLQFLRQKEVVKALVDLDVDVVDLVDCADLVFVEDPSNPLLDHKTMTFIDFLDLITGLNGTNPATVKNIVDIRKSNHIAMSKVEKMLQERQSRMQEAVNRRLADLKAAATRQEAKSTQAAIEYRRAADKMTVISEYLTRLTQSLGVQIDSPPSAPLDNVLSRNGPFIVEARRDSSSSASVAVSSGLGHGLARQTTA